MSDSVLTSVWQVWAKMPAVTTHLTYSTIGFLRNLCSGALMTLLHSAKRSSSKQFKTLEINWISGVEPTTPSPSSLADTLTGKETSVCLPRTWPSGEVLTELSDERQAGPSSAGSCRLKTLFSLALFHFAQCCLRQSASSTHRHVRRSSSWA